MEHAMGVASAPKKMVNGKKNTKREESPMAASEDSIEVNGIAKKNKKNAAKNGKNYFLDFE